MKNLTLELDKLLYFFFAIYVIFFITPLVKELIHTEIQKNKIEIVNLCEQISHEKKEKEQICIDQ